MIELSVADQLLDAVDILIDKSTSGLQFNKTIRGKISDIIDASIGQYKIQYQNSYFTAYSADSSATYQKGSEVYVEILSSDFEKNALILGTVRRLGSNYISIIEQLDRYAEVGAKLTGDNNSVELCSFSSPQDIPIDLDLDPIAVREAAAASDSLKIAMKVKTTLPAEQRAGGGNYGLKVVAEYYNAALTDDAKVTEPTVLREYIFDINNMVGQPYKYSIATDQYTIIPIDTENFIRIVSISAFDENFPIIEENHENDIFLSDIHLQFLNALTEEELQSTALRITTPLGNYFDETSTGNKRLHADLRVKGKKVNYDIQQVDFYWFRRNLAVNSFHEKFSSYGGNGWECLNKAGGGAFLPGSYDYSLSPELCPSKETTFKCVAVFLDNGTSIAISDTIIFKNLTQEIYLSIASTSGTTFSFNMGKTTLTLNGYTPTENTKYCWTESIDGGAAAYYQDIQWRSENTIDVSIETPAATLLTYECSVYEGDELQGTATITLVNNHESLGYTLVIKDGQQIFKYDTYGVSPAAQSKAAADRMVLPVLSFDIYDKQGQLIDIDDNDKIKYMKMRWIWPTQVDAVWSESKYRKQTMLTTTEDMSVISIRDIANNIASQVFALVDKPTFSYNILDRYNAVYANTESARNNIRLEVEYQGEYLSATTNFTFTKEGELGTNGTKYVARIEPNGYKEIFISTDTNNHDQLFGLTKTATGFNIQQIDLGNGKNLNTLFSAQLWDGSSNVAAAARITWSLATSTTRSKITPRLTISSNNVIINTNGTSFSNILQVNIKYDEKQYYATYPIRYIDRVSNNRYLWITDGYNEVMYESDGTRSRFNPLPFRAKWLTTAGYVDILEQTYWSTTWDADIKLVANTIDQFVIEPPSNYIGEITSHYIKLTYENINSYLPIELYLNRYGMSAMNDWDGNSIVISDKNGGYILAPQIGAGVKNVVKDQSGQIIDNAFTGITIGETFQDTVNNKTGKDSQIGMFGYAAGVRSLFLDAETGDAEFGITGKGQIKIHASDGEGTIDSGDYTTEGIGKGLKIKFTSTGENDEQGPYIRYGSGNFTVNSDGHITAKGGGSIAGWRITDDYLRSPDNYSTLYAQNGPDMALIEEKDNGIAYIDQIGEDKVNRTWNTLRPTRFNIHDRFKVNADGAIISTAGVIGGWKIGQTTLMSKDGGSWLFANKVDSTTDHSYMIGPMKTDSEGNPLSKTENDAYENNVITKSMQVGRFSIGNDLNEYSWDNSNFAITSNGNVLGRGASYKFTPHQRKWEITPLGVAYFTDVKIKNQPGDGKDSTKENTFEWRGYDENAKDKYPVIFKLTDTGSQIGGFKITKEELTSGEFKINSANVGESKKTVLSAGEAFKIYGDGKIDATGGKVGGCELSGSSISGGGGGASGFSLNSDGTIVLKGETMTVQSLPFVSGLELNFTVTPGTVGISEGSCTGEGVTYTAPSLTGDTTFIKTITISGTVKRRNVNIIGTKMEFNSGTVADVNITVNGGGAD